MSSPFNNRSVTRIYNLQVDFYEFWKKKTSSIKTHQNTSSRSILDEIEEFQSAFKTLIQIMKNYSFESEQLSKQLFLSHF